MIDILIPTMDNRPYLEPCLRSILGETRRSDYQITVINNGPPGSLEWLAHSTVQWLEPGKNLGWTGGLQLGLSLTKGDTVLFLNDDTLIPPGAHEWLTLLSSNLENPDVGAVGPATNLAIGTQGRVAIDGPLVAPAPFLVGFCFLVRRQALVSAGGVDPSLPGGDDIDLSIRLRKKHWVLLVDKRVFVYHHGFVTGNRVYGPAHVPGGWNSREYGKAVTDALLAKHGPDGLRLIGWEIAE